MFSLPCGHICAIDLNEERIDESNMRPLLPGMVVIIHPSIITRNFKRAFSGGSPSSSPENGYEKLMNSSNEIVVI